MKMLRSRVVCVMLSADMLRSVYLRIPALCLACVGLAACKSKPSSSGPSPDDAAAKAEAPAKAQEPAKPATPLFKDALHAVLANKAPDSPDTKPYGCGVKYAADAPKPDKVAAIGEPAPDFELQDLSGQKFKLSALRGKTVILEWYNPQCPFVEYAYKEGPLKGLAQQSKDKVVWLNINSGAPGKQGSGKALNEQMAKTLGVEHPVLLDESGSVGQMYGAKTTPQMYIINDKGVLVYRGALDNAPFGKVES